MVRPMVHSTKHYVQNSLATTLAGAVSNILIVDAVKAADKNTVSEVEEGNTVKAIYVEDWIRTNDTSAGSFVYCVYKAPAGLTTFTAAEMAALGDADNKKNILFCTQALSNVTTGNAIALHRGWIKIPKSKQRMGLGDRIIAELFAQVLDQNLCGFKTYKEYS